MADELPKCNVCKQAPVRLDGSRVSHICVTSEAYWRRLHGPRHVLTTERLGEALVCHGVIDEAAVADPNGYDGGKTLGALALAARDLAEHGQRLAPEHVEELRACAEWHGDAEQKWTDAIRAALAALGEE